MCRISLYSNKVVNLIPQHYLQHYLTVIELTISSSTWDAVRFHSLECTLLASVYNVRSIVDAPSLYWGLGSELSHWDILWIHTVHSNCHQLDGQLFTTSSLISVMWFATSLHHYWWCRTIFLLNLISTHRFDYTCNLRSSLYNHCNCILI